MVVNIFVNLQDIVEKMNRANSEADHKFSEIAIDRHGRQKSPLWCTEELLLWNLRLPPSVTLSATSSAFEIHSLVAIFTLPPSLSHTSPPLPTAVCPRCTFPERLSNLRDTHDTGASEVKWSGSFSFNNSKQSVDVLQRNKQRHSGFHRPSIYFPIRKLNLIELNTSLCNKLV